MAKLRPKGLSLLETMIVLAIFTMTITAVTGFISQSYRANVFANEQFEAINNARKGIEVMVKEIRESSPAENGAYPIEIADDQNIIFYSDIDSDELIEKIRYTLEGTNLIKGITDPVGFPPQYTSQEQTTILSYYVRNNTEPLFYYYTGNYPNPTSSDPLPTPAAVNQIRLIRTYLQINVDPTRAPQDFVLITNSHLRNLKDNL